jgi:hypothetical protein
LVAKYPVRESKVPAGTHTKPPREFNPFAHDELLALHARLQIAIRDSDAADAAGSRLTGLRREESSVLRVRDVQVLPFLAFRVCRSRPGGERYATLVELSPASRWPEMGHTVKDLRQSTATMWLTNGVELAAVSNWLRHSSVKTTSEICIHWMGQESDAAATARFNDSVGTRAYVCTAEG